MQRASFEGEPADFDQLLPSVVLGYRTERSKWYYSLQRGHKAGGFNFRLNGLDAGTLRYDDEDVIAHELGFNALLLDGRLRTRVALFASDYRDLQQNSNRGDDGVISAAVIRNAARASSRGLETELTFSPSPAWELRLAASWLEAEFESYHGADCTRLQSVVSATSVGANFGARRERNRCAQDLGGARTPHAPSSAGRLGITRHVEFAGLQVAATLEWYHSEAFFTSPHADPLRRQPAFDKLNARVSFGSGRWSAAIVGTNLTDEFTARQLGQDGNAAVSGLIDQPRRLRAQFRYEF